jgi:AcrR family transcriptional regulator
VSRIASKPTQRQRLAEAMIELCAEFGYERVSIAQISSRAGVSSATFYEQFAGKEGCLIEAYRVARGRIFRQIPQVDREADVTAVTRETLQALSVGIQADPDAGRLLFVEALAGGPAMRAERERALEEYEAQVEAYLESRQPGMRTLDIPVAALEGARRYIVSRQLRNYGEDRLPSLAEPLLRWVRSYDSSSDRPRWSIGPEARLPRPPAIELPPPDVSGIWSDRLPRGRHGLPPSVVARSQRMRIITATAEVMLEKGYTGTRVADIVAAAGVSRDVFYENFADKQNAYQEAQQFATQYVVDTCATAYFREETWPMRVWGALGTLLTLIATFPAFAHLRLVECYAAGPAAIRTSEEVLRSASIFLEQGFSYREQACEMPRISTQAITGGVLEIIYRHLARGEVASLPSLLPQLAYVVLAPFTGVEDAIEQVREASARQPLAEQR